MIKNNIVIIPNLTTENTSENIPSWVRNNASWWANDKISEREFVNSLKFLIQKGIITVK